MKTLLIILVIFTWLVYSCSQYIKWPIKNYPNNKLYGTLERELIIIFYIVSLIFIIFISLIYFLSLNGNFKQFIIIYLTLLFFSKSLVSLIWNIGGFWNIQRIIINNNNYYQEIMSLSGISKSIYTIAQFREDKCPGFQNILDQRRKFLLKLIGSLIIAFFSIYYLVIYISL